MCAFTVVNFHYITFEALTLSVIGLVLGDVNAKQHFLHRLILSRNHYIVSEDQSNHAGAEAIINVWYATLANPEFFHDLFISYILSWNLILWAFLRVQMVPLGYPFALFSSTK